MLQRTQKRVGHGREREVGNGRRGIYKKRRNGDGIFLHSRHVTALRTTSCMVAYGW